MAPDALDIKKIAMIGCGSMGGGMALLFAEQGVHVSLQDPSTENVETLLESARKDGLDKRVSKYDDYESLCQSLDEPKVFFWSLPHGNVGDKVLEGLMPYLKKGDLFVDCANEHWQNTERRMGQAIPKGIRYVGCGVSGGYQAARRGPSLCPGGDDETLNLILPLLRKVAARSSDGTPCVAPVGTGAAGHYCKMIHNGIEHGMMSALCEAWGIMTKGLGMSLDEVGDELGRWDRDGELKNTFLVRIGADICRQFDKKTGEHVLDSVEDKVVQDYTGEEGTGVWSNTEAIEQHVPAPTLAVAHFLRIASGDLNQRRRIQETFGSDFPAQKLSISSRDTFLEELRLAVYTAWLAAFAQGLNIIDSADKNFHFNIHYPSLLQVWRAGCIIQSDHINLDLLTPIYTANSPNFMNPLYEPPVAAELKAGFPAMKKIVMKAKEADHVIPSLSATLEYLKYMTSTHLPTSFYEAELDYFGKHMFDKKGDDPDGQPETGKYHFEWKPA